MANKPADGVQLDVPSAHQLYLESVTKDDYVAPTFMESVNPSEGGDLNDNGYVGTDPIYQNHASDTEKPLAADGGAFQAAEEAFVEALVGDPKEGSDRLKDNYSAVSRAETPTEQPVEQPAQDANVPPAPPAPPVSDNK